MGVSLGAGLDWSSVWCHGMPGLLPDHCSVHVYVRSGPRGCSEALCVLQGSVRSDRRHSCVEFKRAEFGIVGILLLTADRGQISKMDSVTPNGCGREETCCVFGFGPTTEQITWCWPACTSAVTNPRLLQHSYIYRYPREINEWMVDGWMKSLSD